MYHILAIASFCFVLFFFNILQQGYKLQEVRDTLCRSQNNAFHMISLHENIFDKLNVRGNILTGTQNLSLILLFHCPPRSVHQWELLILLRKHTKVCFTNTLQSRTPSPLCLTTINSLALLYFALSCLFNMLQFETYQGKKKVQEEGKKNKSRALLIQKETLVARGVHNEWAFLTLGCSQFPARWNLHIIFRAGELFSCSQCCIMVASCCHHVLVP